MLTPISISLNQYLIQNRAKALTMLRESKLNLIRAIRAYTDSNGLVQWDFLNPMPGEYRMKSTLGLREAKDASDLLDPDYVGAGWDAGIYLRH